MSPTVSAQVRCARCGEYIDFGLELWIEGEPYCRSCARLRVTEALSGKGKARSGHET